MQSTFEDCDSGGLLGLLVLYVSIRGAERLSLSHTALSGPGIGVLVRS